MVVTMLSSTKGGNLRFLQSHCPRTQDQCDIQNITVYLPQVSPHIHLMINLNTKDEYLGRLFTNSSLCQGLKLGLEIHSWSC